VLSGVADPERGATAMASLDTHLVRRDAGLIQLLDPPFDNTENDPGYIRDYVPGVRENGGQYTHAAVWAIMAFARLGLADTAWDLLRMINPVEHGRAVNISTYKVEPYVVAADVYAVAPHVGRGGWTWYTGSAGWMYRLIIESLLGFQRHGDVLTIAPCIPSHWPQCHMNYRYGDTTYRIRIQRSADAPARLTIDGIEADGWDISLHDDHVDHVVDGWISS
jgi:cellobiose phosphorylase